MQIRGLILEKLKAGEDAGSIRKFLVDRYGEGILLNPPRRGVQIGVWLAPPAILAAGSAIVVLRLLRRRRPAAHFIGSRDYAEDIERELERRREEP